MPRFEKITASTGWHLNKRPHALPNHNDQPRFQLVRNPLVSIAEYRHQIRDGTELDEECIFKKKWTPCNFARSVPRQSPGVTSFIESHLKQTDSTKSLVEFSLSEQGGDTYFENRLLTPFPLETRFRAPMDMTVSFVSGTLRFATSSNE